MSAQDAVRLPELIGTLYAHAGTYRQLPALLGLVSDALQAQAAHLDLDIGYGYVQECVGDHEIVAEVFDLRLLDNVGLSARFDGDKLTRRIEMPPSSDLLPRVDLRTLSVGTSGLRAAPRSALALWRDASLPAFSARERGTLTQLIPHLSHAITLTHQLETARRNEACAWGILEHLNQGAMLLEANGRVIHANACAVQLLNDSGVAGFPHLRFAAGALRQQFEKALQRASDPLHPQPTVIPLSAVAGSEALVMTVLPCPHQPDLLGYTRTPAQVLIILRTSQGRTAPLSERLMAHFGLTPAEFRLCDALAQGTRLKACAQRWGLAYDTLRVQLKRVFEKTGVHRQGELMALLEAFRETP